MRKDGGPPVAKLRQKLATEIRLTDHVSRWHIPLNNKVFVSMSQVFEHDFISQSTCVQGKCIIPALRLCATASRVSHATNVPEGSVGCLVPG